MCYDAEYIAKKQLKEGLKRGAPKEYLDKLWLNLVKAEQERFGINPVFTHNWDSESRDIQIGDNYHVSGFSRPWAFLLTDHIKPQYELARWGYVPTWVKNESEVMDYKKPYNLNLNAQSESMFKSRAFSHSARHKRCVIQLDAYYEHHDHKGKKYPFRISHVNGNLWVAGLYENNEFIDQESGEMNSYSTFALVTCKANNILSKIHNNPKMVARTGHRMLALLDEDQIAAYLKPFPITEDKKEEELFEMSIINLCQPYDEDLLTYQTVRNLKPRKDMEYLGNVPTIREEYVWPELDLKQILS